MMRRKGYIVQRIAMLAVHSSPLATLGGREAGGMNVYVRELACELGRRGLAVDIFTRSQRRGEPQIVRLGSNTRVVTLRAGPAVPYNKNWVLDYLPEFVSRIRCFADGQDLHYDIIHSHYWLSGAAALELRKMWGAPIVQMFHTLGVMKNQVAKTALWNETNDRIEIEGRLLHEADTIIAATPLERAQMQFHYGVETDRIVVLPGGVDIRRFRPHHQTEARRRLGLPSQPTKIVLFVGRIEPLKGLDTLIQALALLAARRPVLRPHLQLMVVGGGTHTREDQWSSEERRLRALVDELSLGDIVHFAGAWPQRQLPLLYNAADVVAVPSHYESFGLVALEAQACGTPVVASRVGGLTYTVQDGVSGFLVPPYDAVAFAQRIESLLLHEGMREKMGARAVVRAQSYAWPCIADRVLALYQTVAHRRQPAHAIVPLRIPRCALH
jgi:D-inositol-3-phosphate glycosyltransferase